MENGSPHGLMESGINPIRQNSQLRGNQRRKLIAEKSF
jgi:hypothetical protein